MWLRWLRLGMLANIRWGRDMSAVEVSVYEKGVQVARVKRPLRDIDGQPAVKFRRKLWPLTDGDKVFLDGCPPASPAPELAATPSPPVIEDKVSTDDEIIWADEQLKVLKANPSERILVSAGPGTGKTAVACARVAEIINEHDLSPSRVWLISFTRTAVREVADRIASYLDDPGSAFSIKIATLDSRAWAIHSGFDEEATLLGDYEQNIARVLELIEESADAQEHLEQIQHLIVDEAQDVVGVRADLVLGIMARLSSQCGVTVFADEAQAIYGFASDEDAAADGGREPNLVERLRKGDGGKIGAMELTKVHRTQSPQLLEIFTETRRLLLNAEADGAKKLASVTDDVWRLGHGKLSDVTKQDLAGRNNLFVLFRRRSDVLLASSFLGQVPHRVRMSGMPVCIEPWVGAVFWDYLNPDIDQDSFISLWTERVAPSGLASKSVEEAWALLVRLAGRTKSVVDVRRMRRLLGRARPATDFCTPELGEEGPIIGTIHASKGRETDIVHVMLPGEPKDGVDLEEEARVIFVAATRGRKELRVGRGYGRGAGRIEPSGRVYRIIGSKAGPRVQVEIGRDGDIHAEGIAGRRYFKEAADVKKAQTFLRNAHQKILPADAFSDQAAEFAFLLTPEGSDQAVAVLSNSLNSDLFKIGRVVQEKHGGGKRKPPDFIRHLRVIGIRTIVLAPDAAEAERLHSPWNETGILLAPIVLGFTTTYLPTMKGKFRA
jgi:hypothetical protein